MFQNCDQKQNNQQQLRQSLLQRIALFASKSNILKQRREIFKILFQSVSVSSNALLLTRIRFTQLINFCFSFDQTFKFGCSSVFAHLNQQQEIESRLQDENYEQNLQQNMNQEYILDFVQNQFKMDSQSILNTLRLIAPIYLIMSLFFNIVELANKKQKIDILMLFLVLITVSDLLFFNSAYSFSNIKPNRFDSELFNSNISTYNMSFLSTKDQEVLQYAQNDIFLIANRAIIAYCLITRVIAILINAIKLYKNTKTLSSSKTSSKKIQQTIRTSPKKETPQKNSKKQDEHIQKDCIDNQGRKNSLKTSNPKSKSTTQETKQIQKAENSQKKQKKLKTNIQTQLLNEMQENSKLIKIEENDIHEEINHSPKKNLSKKSKDNTKTTLKSNVGTSVAQQAQNNGKNQQSTNFSQCQVSEEVQFQADKKNKSTNLKKKEVMKRNSELLGTNYQLDGNLKIDSVELSDNQIEKKFQESEHEQEKNNNQQKINEIQIQQHVININQITSNSEIQNQNSQIYLDSHSNLQMCQIPEIQSHELQQSINSINSNNLISSPDMNSSKSPDMNCSIISPIIGQISNNQKQNNIPNTSDILRQSSYESADFCLNEQNNAQPQSASINFSQNHLQEENSINNSISLHSNQINQKQQQIEVKNSDQNKLNQQTGDFLIIEQVNEELRKKWMLKQKASKLQKKNLNSSSNTLQSIQENSIHNNSNFINQSQISQNDNNLSYTQGGNNNNNQSHTTHILSHDQPFLQDDLDISTNDESNFNSINSNYDGQIITKQNTNSTNLKSLSQHLLNQQASFTQAQKQQQQYQQQFSSQEHLRNNQQQNCEQAGFNDIFNQETQCFYQSYSEQQYHEEQCYNTDNISRTPSSRTSGLRTCGSKNVQQKHNQYFEDSYQDPSQKCFEEFVKMNQSNINKQQFGQINGFQNHQGNHNPFQFYYDEEEEQQCQGQENKTPFEIFYDQQCMIDEDYDEEEELDQFQENFGEDNDDDEDEEEYNEDEEEDDDDDEDEDEDEDEQENQYSQNKKQKFNTKSKHTSDQMKLVSLNKNLGSNTNQENGAESIPDNNSTLMQSQLHNTDIYSLDELKSHLGDYLDMMNDSQLTNNDMYMKKCDLNISISGSVYEDGGKIKKKKKKSKEQKRKRRCKRKLKKRLERSMMESEIQSIQGPEKTDLNISINSQAIPSGQSNTKKKQNNKKNNKNYNKKKGNNNQSFSKAYGDQMVNQYSNCSGYSLKRMLDENLLEYFTFTVSISQGVSVNIYITDFYQFDEQFEMQSCIYGIDSSTILDLKINLIFEILTLNLYPNMNNFFEYLISNYSMAKMATSFTQQNLKNYSCQDNSELTEMTEQYCIENNLAALLAESNMNDNFSQENNFYNSQLVLTQ
ncbi:hypothetical protein ABPG74_013555 [Tetrahymena malaccensis]